MKSNITVIITTHQQYLEFIDECIISIEKQSMQPDEIIIMADNVMIPAKYRKYKISHGKFGSPNPGRNFGIELATTDWIIFFDGDDIMGEGYIEQAYNTINNCKNNIGVLYPSLQFFYNQTNIIRNKIEAPDWDYWGLRQGNFIDTSSVWRKQALLDVGKWDYCGLDDYSLALKLTSKGWEGLPLKKVYNQKRQYKDIVSRFSETYYSPEFEKSLWEGRSFAILTLFAGRQEHLPMWENWIKQANLPPNITLYILDNSKDNVFSGQVQNIINDTDIKKRFKKIYYQINNTSFDIELQKKYYDPYMHEHVAKLYNEIFPLINEDFILTIEDDVNPPLNGLKQLHQELDCPTTVGAIAGAYPLFRGHNYMTASINKEDWIFDLPFKEYQNQILEIGFTGGGFTLWSNFAIKKVLPVHILYAEDFIHGWDYNLCLDIRNAGFQLKLNTFVNCDHLKQKVD